MDTFVKGAVVMGSLMASALGALFKENEQIVQPAKVLGGVAACRIHYREQATNLATGERVWRWEIEFKSEEDMQMFDAALRDIVGAVTGEER